MYTLPTYFRDVWPILPLYKARATWFRWPQDDVTVLNGWRMYDKAAHNALGLLLLGDTAIRSDKALMFNFGLTSAHGVQEQKEVETVAELMGKRRAIAAPIGARPVEVLGPGSILSDKDWSPLLNDSFVLGGVNACQEFHLADDAFHGFVPRPPTQFEQRRAVFGEVAKPYLPSAKEKWKAYIKATPTVFWNVQYGVPRVFAREVIGMMTFGYKPVFTLQELAFDCADQGKAMSASFPQYIAALDAVNFSANDRPTITAKISEYLFGEKGWVV